MKKKILVVDDELAIRELLKFRLARRGFDVITARDEREFWDQALNEKPDLIILDILLHNKLGTDIYDTLLNFGLDPSVPVIFITALVEKQAPKKVQSGAKYALFSKPFDFDKLVRIINKFISDSERGAEEGKQVTV